MNSCRSHLVFILTTALLLMAVVYLRPASSATLTLSGGYPEASFSLYQVALYQDHGYQASADFATLPLTADALSPSNEERQLELLSSLFETTAPTPYRQGTADANGLLTFTALPEGLYYIRGASHSEDGSLYIPSARLLILPTSAQVSAQVRYECASSRS